jgi:flagellar hook-associated protein 3 FlgL
MLSTTRTKLDTAAKTMDSHIGILGNTYNRIEELDTQHDETAVAIKSNLSAVEDVDMADAISKLQLVQTQLQASYKVTTTLKSINLIDFL